MAQSFNTVWTYLQRNLLSGTIIKNWTVLKGYFGQDLTIKNVYHEAIAVQSPGAKNTQFVPYEDFEAVWGVWEDYKKTKFQRQEIRDMTRYSKYIISILNWYEQEQKRI